MRANLALLDWTSDGIVRKKFGNISVLEREGEEAPYDSCGLEVENNKINV